MRHVDAPVNQVHLRTIPLLETNGPPPWISPAIDDGQNNASIMASGRGEGNKDPHIHTDFNETWIILEGELDFEIGDFPTLRARAGDVMISPVGTTHIISSVGDRPSLRLAIAKQQSDHNLKGTRGSGGTPLPPGISPPNLVHTSVAEVVAAQGPAPWSQEIILNVHNRINLICTRPGDEGFKHVHPDFAQWWVVLRGELVWEIEGFETTGVASRGDLIFAPAGRQHVITTVGDEDALRLSITPGKKMTTVLPDGTTSVLRPELKGLPHSLA